MPSNHLSRSPWARQAELIAYPILSGLVFLVSSSLGLALNRSSDGIAAFWPANAILLATLILSDRRSHRRHLLACAITGLISNRLAGTSFAHAGVFALANVITSALVFRILVARSQADTNFDTIASLSRFFAAIAVGVGTGATIACSVMWIESGTFFIPWLDWCESDLLGMLLITPLIVTCRRQAWEFRQAGRTLLNGRRLSSLLVVAGASSLVFYQSRFPLLFVPLALVMIATYQLGLLGAVAGTAIVALISSWQMTVGHGPIALVQSSIAVRVHFFQFYLLTLCATAMPLAAMISERARSAKKRSESDRRHRRILDQSRELIFETDVDGRWTYLNPAWESLTGRSLDDSIGRTLQDLLEPADCAAALACLAKLYAQETDECHQDLRYVHTDGQTRWVTMRAHLLVDDQGAATGTYGSMHDVTSRVTAQAAQAESERMYRLLADHSNDMIVHLGANGVRKYVSPASRALLGYDPEEMMRQPAVGAIHPDDRATVIATCRTLLDGVENPICSYRQLHKNGQYVWLEASYRLVPNDTTGEPNGFIASVRDVSKRAQAELDRARSMAQLEEANRLLLMAEEMSAVGHWRVDVASGMAYWSDMVCAIHGRPCGYIPTVDTAIEAYHLDDRAAIQAAVDAAIEHGQGYSLSARLIRTDGMLRHVVMTGRAEIGPDGSVTELFGVFQDVTEAYEAQKALVATGEELASSNRMLKMAEAVASLGHWRIDQSNNTLFWSEEVYRIFGVPPSSVPTLENAYSQYHPDDIERVRATIRKAMHEKTGYQSRSLIIRTDGAQRHILSRGEVEFGPDGEAIGLFGTIQDVTNEVIAENLRQAQAEQYFFITQQASDLISLTDVNGKCHFVSPSCRAILGYEPDEMIGTTPYDYAPEEDYPLLDQQRRELAKRPTGEVAPLRFRMRRKDGVYIWMDVAGRVAAHGKDTRIISVGRDISAQVEVERELRHAQLQAEAAVAAKSSFLANMSHEIRTPMNGVLGFTELLLNTELDKTQRDYLLLIADSGRAMMRLLNDILDTSRIEAGSMAAVPVAFGLPQLLRGAVGLMAPVGLQKNVPIYLKIAEGLGQPLFGDVERIRQIVLNLLGNAVKFTEKGCVTVEARIDRNVEPPALQMAVTDTGIGIAPHKLDRVFDKFAQADDTIGRRFGGTGLGLSISRNIAHLLGGEISLASEIGEGSVFTLTLPLVYAQGSDPAPPDGVNDPPPLRGDIRVLVAEDHEINQALVMALTRSAGMTPVIACDGADAIRQIVDADAKGDPFALVLMDVQMPQVDGLEATRRLRAIGYTPELLPIVALTANAYADDIAACLAAGMQAHIAKPIRIRDLEKIAHLARKHDRPIPRAGVPAGDPVAGLAERYAERRDAMFAALHTLLADDAPTEAAVGVLIDELHKLAGTAAFFDEARLGEEAGALERQLRSCAPKHRVQTLRTGLEVLVAAA